MLPESAVRCWLDSGAVFRTIVDVLCLTLYTGPCNDGVCAMRLREADVDEKTWTHTQGNTGDVRVASRLPSRGAPRLWFARLCLDGAGAQSRADMVCGGVWLRVFRTVPLQSGAGPINGPVRNASGQSVTRPVERMMSLASPVLRNSMNDCAAERSAAAFAIAASNTVPSFIESGMAPR